MYRVEPIVCAPIMVTQTVLLLLVLRLSVDEKTVVCGFQDQNGIYIGILSNKLARNEICKRMMLLIPARTREQAVFQARGRVQRGNKPLSQEF